MTDNGGKAIQKYRIYIKATPQAVWDALTKPEWSVRYGYPNYPSRLKKGFLAASGLRHIAFYGVGTLNVSVGQSPRHACHDGVAGSPDFYNFAQSTR